MKDSKSRKTRNALLPVEGAWRVYGVILLLSLLPTLAGAMAGYIENGGPAVAMVVWTTALSAVVCAALLLAGAWRLMMRWRRREDRAGIEQVAAARKYAAEVVHEMRNPMTVARGLAQLIHAEETDQRRRMWVWNIMRQLDQMNTMASDFLKFASPRELELAVTSVGELLEETEAVSRPYLEGCMVQLEVGYSAAGIRVKCDPAHVSQVLLNLVRNAAEAVGGRPDPKVSIKMRFDRRSAFIDVIDNGPGIPEGDIPRLFEPFFTTKQNGTGLGLAICKGLIEKQGGTVSARNAEEGGAVFTIELPRAF